MQTETVFVYGTLRAARNGIPKWDTRFRPRIEPFILASEPGRLQDAILFDMGLYPAARPGKGEIVGELLTVTPRGLAEMDEIESHPFHYVRTRVTVEMGAGPVLAWVYWAPEDLVNGARLIESGDWFARERGGF
ncbi:MAG: gamma-glutamylcyclotransferase [Anaerolineales bacterium]